MRRQRKFLSVIVSILMLSMLIGTLGIFSGAAVSDTILVEGAQIRTEGVQGLRFVAKIDKSAYSLTTGENANFGILIIPQNKLGKGELIDVDTETVGIVPAKNIMENTEEYYKFTAVLTGLPAEFYGTEIVARAYVEQDGVYTYSNQLARSVKTVAEMILDNAQASDNEIQVANEVLAKYEQVGDDITVNYDEILNPSKLIEYPEYPEEIARDYMYSVSVRQKNNVKELTVYNHVREFFYQDRFDGGDTNRRFCEFAFSGSAVTVDVKVNTDFDTYSVIPTSKGFESTYADGVISITMDKPEQVVVILDDDVNTALAIFADAPETDVPDKDDVDVYVEGFNDITINATSGVTMNDNGELTVTAAYCDIYIAPGAVLNSRIYALADQEESAISYKTKIYGRGIILDPYSNIYEYDPSAATTNALVRLGGYSSEVKDVKLLDARCFNLNMDRGDGVVDNVKILSTEMTSDGITTAYGDATVENCFIYCGDNAIVTQGTGNTFENITIGTTCSAIYPQYACSDITFNDIYVFRADEGLVAMKHGTDAKTVVINNLDALDCVRTPWLFFAEDVGSGAKNVTFNKVLMNYTTGSSNVGNSPATSLSSCTLFKANLLSSGSNYTFTIKDLYVGGNLVTQDNSNFWSSLSATKTYSTSGNTPAKVVGDKITVNYVYDRKVIVGNREVFLERSPLIINGEWYLPYEEMAAAFCIKPQNPETIENGTLISVDALRASGAITAGSYDEANGAIVLAAAVDASVDIFQDNAGVSSDYNRLYYKDKTEYLKAVDNNGTWEYTAKSLSSDGGIVRMILDEYKQYGAGTYKLSFEYKSSARVTVGYGKNHNKSVSTQSLYTQSNWTSGSYSFTISDNPDTVNQLAIFFKVSSGNTVSIRNVTLTKTN